MYSAVDEQLLQKVLPKVHGNRIASYVREMFEQENLSGEIDVYTFHELLMKICSVDQAPEDETDLFFKELLPKYLSLKNML